MITNLEMCNHFDIIFNTLNDRQCGSIFQNINGTNIVGNTCQKILIITNQN